MEDKEREKEDPKSEPKVHKPKGCHKGAKEQNTSLIYVHAKAFRWLGGGLYGKGMDQFWEVYLFFCHQNQRTHIIYIDSIMYFNVLACHIWPNTFVSSNFWWFSCPWMAKIISESSMDDKKGEEKKRMLLIISSCNGAQIFPVIIHGWSRSFSITRYK